MSRTSVIAISILSLCLSACTMNDSGAHFTGMSAGNDHPGGYCYEHTAVCVAAGVAAVGVTAIVISNNNDHHAPVNNASDIRLKRDIRPLMVTDNGLKIYTFRYAGDDRLFSGVLAQDLLKDPEFAGAVSTGADGYYRVDYTKLGLSLVNGRTMLEAGEKAAAAF